ncbi:hypothetical protein TURU_055268 [Turdus rufiventris]|nr:hypothetical protein TURU_055268 [Turdus rufiventris]
MGAMKTWLKEIESTSANISCAAVKQFSVLPCRITLYDYQAMCRTNKESSDSAHSLLDNMINYEDAGGSTQTCPFAKPYYVNNSAQDLEIAITFVNEREEALNLGQPHHLLESAQRLKQTLEPCDTEYPAFVSERTIKETTGNIACDDCFNSHAWYPQDNVLVNGFDKTMGFVPKLGHRSFVIQQIPSSNLFMVVVDNECFCDSIPPITMAPIEIRYILFFTSWSERHSRCKY